MHKTPFQPVDLKHRQCLVDRWRGASAVTGCVAVTLVAAGIAWGGGRMSADEEQRMAAAAASAERAGERVNVEGFDFDAIPMLDMNLRDADGPLYLLSDKPEYFRTGDGIAMQEVIEPGDVRLYVYHVPTPEAGPRYITATIENLGDSAMTVSFSRRVVPPPGGDYHAIGKAGLVGLFSTGEQDLSDRTLNLEPGQTTLLDADLLDFELTTHDLIHGIYEFTIDQPARVSVLQTSPGDDPAEKVHSLDKLPQILPGFHASGAGRGQFRTSARELDLAAPWDTADGVAQVVWADGVREPWIIGTDGIDGDAEVENKGNYGVIYRIRLPWTSSDGRDVALMTFNPRAGAQWCNFQAWALRLETQGRFDAGEDAIIQLPADQIRFGGPPEAVVIQIFDAGEGEGVIELTYSPPGASCLPTPLVLVPVDRR